MEAVPIISSNTMDTRNEKRMRATSGTINQT